MTTKQITFTGYTIRPTLQTELKQKADELSITGTLKVNEDGSLTIVSSGTKENIENYLEWCQAAALEHGINTDNKEHAFKAYYKFSLT